MTTYCVYISDCTWRAEVQDLGDQLPSPFLVGDLNAHSSTLGYHRTISCGLRTKDLYGLRNSAFVFLIIGASTYFDVRSSTSSANDISMCFRSLILLPVSYTHLDVYKRQH